MHDNFIAMAYRSKSSNAEAHRMTAARSLSSIISFRNSAVALSVLIEFGFVSAKMLRRLLKYDPTVH